MATFKVTRKIRFGQTDAAGITYYPRLVEMINDIVEDFFADAVKFSYKEMIVETDYGVPTVNLNVTFKSPAELEDYVDWYLVVTKIGRSSFSVLIDAKVGEKEILTADVKLVYIKGKGNIMKSHPLPDHVREVMQDYLVQE
ncbi:MAG: acyl-CoA thioesterase [Kordiimonadaceae bacterium]|jgi:4-hydroxybenzoyl-CoA thioesterase|nr:acyl-CoA thioesterase [Kordiimonadaceae bacterium]MBT6036377.1 acyl-CoA thioesterase [Kordiimonadaceae bacterium]MBT6330270.1 acyl-CoA thioesterase [Kordiimonadaceae bacterium]MBT7582495.1 acyl-CoA thioesterase [Kordiimonadaceae bacterium]